MKNNLFYRKETGYKPHYYPQAMEYWNTHEQMHWLSAEVPMDKDVQDWKSKLNEGERNFLTQIFRFFTQGDCDVAGGYLDNYIPLFSKHSEIRLMLAGFAAREAIHVEAYSKLISTVGMPDTEYDAFLNYKEMAAKHNYIDKFNLVNNHYDEDGYYDIAKIAKTLAVYSAFTEGLQLFSSFAMLMNFARFGKMKGMSQIVTWSVRDESLHVEAMTWLFRTLIKENKKVWTDEFKGELYQICRDMVELEDNFIDLAFATGGIEGLTAEEMKLFVRHIADRRLLQLGLKANYKVKDNPLPWYELMLNSVEHANFFETRVTEYSKGTMTGEWNDVFSPI